MQNEKILIVDDDPSISKLVSSYLENENLNPVCTSSGKDALLLAASEKPDLIILDIMLPDIEGTALCLELRKISNAPIIFLSCKTQEIDKIIALSSGGDDYITKPFMPGELVARVKAHLRRQNLFLSDSQETPPENFYRFKTFTVDFDAYELIVNGKAVSITTKEFEILKLLIENPRKVFSATQIFESVWKTMCMENDTKTIMVYISNLRKKIETNADSPEYIISVRGVGYKFNQSPLT